MEWFWFIVAAAGGAGFAARWWRVRQATRRTTAEDLEGVRDLVGEDITYLHVGTRLLPHQLLGHGASLRPCTDRPPEPTHA